MLHTRFCELVGVELPIISAGMGAVALAKLAAAVSEAGGLGTIGLAGLTLDEIRSEIAAARRLTRKPIAVNLLVPFLRDGMIDAIAREQVAAATFFWGDPAAIVPPAKRAGLKIIWQCGSPEEALAAKRAGADAIMAQGIEAGGHVRGTTTTLALVPDVRDAIGPEMALIAAGGFADGRGLAAALALGADAAVFGTRFLASDECAAHPLYKQAIVAGRAEETVHTKLFDVGWPNAAHRVIRTCVVEEWERAGAPAPGKRPGEGTPIGTMRRLGREVQLVKYSVMSPADYVEGEIAGFPFYAGQSVSQVHDILPAGEIVRRIAAEAREVISNRLSSLIR